MGKKGNKEDFLPKFAILMGITIAIVIFFTNSISKRQEERNKMLMKEHELVSDVEQLEKENSKLFKQHNSLLTDPVEIERYAREQLNYVAPGEQAYDIVNYRIKTDDEENEDVESQVMEKTVLEKLLMWQVPAIIILVSSIVYYVSYILGDHKQESEVRSRESE